MGENYSHLKRNGQFDNAKAFWWRRATNRSWNSRGLQQRMLWWNRNYKFKQQRASYTCKRAWKLQYHPTWYRKRSMLSVSNAWRDAGHETLTLDIDPKCMPDICTDIMSCECSQIYTWLEFNMGGGGSGESGGRRGKSSASVKPTPHWVPSGVERTMHLHLERANVRTLTSPMITDVSSIYL